MIKGLLIDSHIFLWLLQEPHKISAEVRRLLETSPQRYVSLASIWELGIKYEKGKLAFSAAELFAAASKLGMDTLRIEPPHIAEATTPNISHKDPFDKMLLAQAKVENLEFITSDSKLLQLGLDYVINAKA